MLGTINAGMFSRVLFCICPILLPKTLRKNTEMFSRFADTNAKTFSVFLILTIIPRLSQDDYTLHDSNHQLFYLLKHPLTYCHLHLKLYVPYRLMVQP